MAPPPGILEGIDVLVQLGEANAESGVTCKAFGGIAVRQPVRIFVVPDESSDAGGWAADVRDGIVALLVTLAATAGEVSPPCNGGLPPFRCAATGDGNVSNVLVWVAATSPSDAANEFVAEWLDRGDRFDAIGVVSAEADLDVLPERLRAKQATIWRDDPAEVTSELLSFAQVMPAENRVFVSYRHGEGDPLAGELFHLLSEARFDVFLDRFSLDPGTDWVERLEEELADKAFVLVVETPSIDQSQWIEREVEFARKHRLGLAAIAHGGQLPAVGEARRFHLGPGDWLPQPKQDPLRPSGRASHLPPPVAQGIADFVLQHHGRALVRRRRVLDRALRLALMWQGVSPARVGRAAGGIDVANGRGCSIDVTVRPPRLVDFHTVDRRAQGLGSKAVLMGPRAAGAVRRETIDWLAYRSGVSHYDEGRLLELAKAVASGVFP